jgi:hypothetical protein
MEKDNEIVTARGKPSGTATTTIVIPITKSLASASKRFRTSFVAPLLVHPPPVARFTP